MTLSELLLPLTVLAAYLVLVCDDAYEKCPDVPLKTCRLHWSIKDPSGFASPLEQLEAFRRTREDLRQRIEQWRADQPEAT